MVLSAITAAGEIVTPYKMLAQGLSTHEAFNQIRKAQDRGVIYFCPHCLKFYKKQIPVRFRGTSPENARPHFFHPSDGTDKCSASSPESEQHIYTKDYLAEWLRREKGASEVFVEYHLDNLDGQIRRPDILAIYGHAERVEAHEIQVSPINSSEIAQRTEDILAQCIKKWPNATASVTWYLAHSNARKREIKDYFLGSGHEIKGERVQWDGEDKIPSWLPLLSLSDFTEYKNQRESAERSAQKEKDLLERKQKYQQQQHEWAIASNKNRRVKLLLTLNITSRIDFPASFEAITNAHAAATKEYERQVQAAAEKNYQRMLSGNYIPGDTVRGAPGRVSEVWQGKIVRPQGHGWIVNWDGRRNHENPAVRKRPELFMLTEQIVPLPTKSHGITTATRGDLWQD